MRTLLKPLSFIPALLLMYMIFSFSGQTGDVSSQMSFNVSCKIVEAGDYIFDANLDQWQIEEWANKINFITRKLAHMTEYFALAVAVAFPLYVYGMHGILLMLTAGILCVGFACGDEYHQSFVSGRSPSFRDVAIDSVGIFFGIIVVRVIGWTGRKTIFRPKNKKVKPRKQKVKRTKKIKQKNIHNYQEGPVYHTPPYQGGYQQQAPPPYQNQNPYPGGQPHYQGQVPGYKQSYQQGTPNYSDDPFVNPSYNNVRPPHNANGSPNQPDPYYNNGASQQQTPPYNTEPPYWNSYPEDNQPPYGDGGFQDPYQDPNFRVDPPEEHHWDGISYDTPKPQKKKRKKKDKDWFFDM